MKVRFVLTALAMLAASSLTTAPASRAFVAAPPAPMSATACGQPGSGCEVLAGSIPNPRSLSKVQPDGSFFVGSAGSPAQDLFAEGAAGPGSDSDSSTIYRYTQADGLRPWVTPRTSQLLTVFDASFNGFVPYQAGVNGVEVAGGDLVYTIHSNRGTSNYVERMRSYTADTGISFSEVRRIAGGATDPNGAETVVADMGRAEIENNNPDGVLHAADNLGHKAGDPEYLSNPFGLVPDGDKLFVVDPGANTLYRVRQNGKPDLLTVFTHYVTARQPVPTNIFRGPGGKLYATLFRCANLFQPGAGGAIVEVSPDGKARAVSFHSLPISATFGPDGHLYVLEYANLFSPNSGRVLRTTPQDYADFDGRPVSDGVVVVEGLNFPIDLEFDREGRLLVLESADLDPFKTDGRITRFRLP